MIRAKASPVLYGYIAVLSGQFMLRDSAPNKNEE